MLHSFSLVSETILLLKKKKKEKIIIHIFTTQNHSLLVFWPICFKLFWKSEREAAKKKERY